MSHKNRKMLILLDKLHIIAVTFNQVVRGSSPRCLMEKKMAETLRKLRGSAIFAFKASVLLAMLHAQCRKGLCNHPLFQQLGDSNF